MGRSSGETAEKGYRDRKEGSTQDYDEGRRGEGRVEGMCFVVVVGKKGRERER